MRFPESLLPVLEQGGRIITANARAARDLRTLYTEHRLRTTGRHAWKSPAIVDWQAWLASEWQQLLLTGTEPRLLLSPLQETSLWAEIVRADVEARSLITSEEIAHLAQSAYARLAAYDGLAHLARKQDWGASYRLHGHEARHGSGHEDEPETQEPELFRRWALEFERKTERYGWLSPALLPAVLAHAYESKLLTRPPAIAWVGFDRVSPAEAKLRAALVQAGCLLHESIASIAGEQRRVAAGDSDHEIGACAHWVRDHLALHPDARVGVLVTDAEAARPQIERIFRRVLMPGSIGLRTAPEKLVYEFTLGLPLGNVPVVRAALLLLQWLDGPLEREQIGWLLSTGFVGDSEHSSILEAANLRLDQDHLLPPEENLDAFLRRLERSSVRSLERSSTQSTAIETWTKGLRQARLTLARMRGEQSHRQWAEAAEQALATAGWPGTRMRDSIDYQVHDRWCRVLEDVVSLDFAGTRTPWSRFCTQLAAHAHASLFAAESEGAPVSISGIVESAGRVFDAVWTLGTTDDAWPARSSAHPLLPRWLQAELRMPRGDAGEDWAFSQAVTQRLRAATQHIVFSYAHQGASRGMACSQRPSALITGIAEEAAAPIMQTEEMLLAEDFYDDSAIAWPGLRSAGGADVLEMQAACPFKAFAVRRLGARDARSSGHGLDASQRGSLLHEILRALWKDHRMPGSEALHAMVANGTITGYIAEHIDQALLKYRVQGAWEQHYLALERERLASLIDDWLLVELNRKPFLVENAEEDKTVEVAGLSLHVRIDRVDRLMEETPNSGARVLIDYKTGVVNAAQWKGERPDAPQLPLYALAGGIENLHDVYFAQLRPGELKFVGALDSKGSALYAETVNEDVTDKREVQWQEWATALAALSREFQEGVAAVSPKKYPDTCKYCALIGLCRVAESGSSVLGMEPDDEYGGDQEEGE